MLKVEEVLNLLGRKATDKITGAAGVVDSVCFDLYGCVQAAIRPPVNDKGEQVPAHWFDVSRLVVSEGSAVMPVPDFGQDKGPADKPAR